MYQTVIGLEVHTQLKTESKLFCSCSTKFENPANSNVCPVCCGYPGVLPVFNEKVLDLALRVALALNCRINKDIYFERKSYFYPDLPKNYQISQFKMPLGENGYMELSGAGKIRVNRVHMEEDAGKLIHKDAYSLVDFNRTGTPLLEIVSEPDISSPQQAFEYLTQLKLLLQYIGASDCDMEKGSLRCDANISLKTKEAKQLGTKVELKNMNTFRGVRAALEFEAKRQAKALAEGEKIHQETRLWNSERLKTVVMRSKEGSDDYRYFPEPDLLNFAVSDQLIRLQTEMIGELPGQRKARFLKQYKISEKEIEVFVANKFLADFFEKTVKFYSQPQKVANWVLGPYLEQVNNLPEGTSVKISAENFAKIVRYFSEGKMNNLSAKKLLSFCIATNADIDDTISKESLAQVSDESQLEVCIEEVINKNPKPVKEYSQGKQQAIMFLVGQVMKMSRGKANPKVVRGMLEGRLKK